MIFRTSVLAVSAWLVFFGWTSVFADEVFPLKEITQDFQGDKPPLSRKQGNETSQNRDEILIKELKKEVKIPGFLIRPERAFSDEAGSSAIIHISLRTRPIAPVKIILKNSNPEEGRLNKEEWVFDTNNWNQPQQIQVKGKDDAVTDGDQVMLLHFSAVISRDLAYNGRIPEPIKVMNRDNDNAGFLVTKIKGPSSERGDVAVVLIKLASRPVSPVRILVQSSDPTEAIAMEKEILFLPETFNQSQQLSLKGMDDGQVDGDQVYQLLFTKIISEDPGYSALKAKPVHLINRDNDSIGVRVSPVTGRTTEKGGSFIFHVKLLSQPAEEVRLPLSSSDITEGKVFPEELVFTPENWKQPQQGIVKGVEDDQADKDQSYQVRLHPLKTGDPDYRGLDPEDIRLINSDQNKIGLVFGKTEGQTSEEGAEVRLPVKLDSKPTGLVEVLSESRNPGEGTPVNPRLVFTGDNWNQFQTIIIRGVDDFIQDGPVTYQVQIRAVSQQDPDYQHLTPATFAFVNQDNDQAGIIMRQEGTKISEKGDTARSYVRLASKPESSVVMVFEVDKKKEAELKYQHRVFTPGNWNREQVVEIIGLPDRRIDGDQEVLLKSLGIYSDDPLYDKRKLNPVRFMNLDRDQAEINLKTIMGNSSEDGEIAKFSLSLSSRPEEAVSLKMKSSDETEGVVAEPLLVIQPENWNQPHVISVKGMDDEIKDQDAEYFLKFEKSESEDPYYNGLQLSPVLIRNLNNMRYAPGVALSSCIPFGEMAEEFNTAAGWGITGNYEMSNETSLTTALNQYQLKGSKVITSHTVEHPMEYRMDLTMLNLGVRYQPVKTRVKLLISGGAGLYSWHFTSEDRLNGRIKKASSLDPGLWAGLGAEQRIYENIVGNLEASYHQVYGGMNGRRFVNVALSCKYPF